MIVSELCLESVKVHKRLLISDLTFIIIFPLITGKKVGGNLKWRSL